MDGQRVSLDFPSVYGIHGQNEPLRHVHDRDAAYAVFLLLRHSGSGIVGVIFGNVDLACKEGFLFADFRLNGVDFGAGGVEGGETVDDGDFADKRGGGDNERNGGGGDAPVNGLFADSRKVDGTLDGHVPHGKPQTDGQPDVRRRASGVFG